MSLAKPIRVMIVDDHAAVRRGLGVFLRIMNGIHVVGEACDGAQAIRLAQPLQPDVILMDLLMPLVNGVEAISTIRKLQPQIRILALTGFEDDALIRAALAAGAVGYLIKDATPHQLAQTIYRVYESCGVVS